MMAVIAMMAVIGLIPTVPLFVAVFMRIEGREKWQLIAGYAAALTLTVYLIFDQLLRIPWPQTLLGQWFPALTVIPSV